MCLLTSDRESLKLKFDKNNEIECYKVLAFSTRPDTDLLDVISPLYGKVKWRPGLIKAEKVIEKPVPITNWPWSIFANIKKKRIKEGIHVFTTEKKAKDFAGFFEGKKNIYDHYYLIVKVRARREDLLGYGGEQSQACFTQIYIDENEFSKAVKKVHTASIEKYGHCLINKELTKYVS